VPHLREPVDALAVGLGDHTDRAAVVVDHHDRTVRPLGEQVDRVADGVGGAERDRRVVHEVPLLDPGDHVGDHVEGDVLRDHRDRAAAGDRLGHPAPGDGRHVGDDEGDRRAGAVGGRQVDVEPRADLRMGRCHEDVAVGQVVRGCRAVEKPHSEQLI
jgi:hypothetical protein